MYLRGRTVHVAHMDIPERAATVSLCAELNSDLWIESRQANNPVQYYKLNRISGGRKRNWAEEGGGRGRKGEGGGSY